ncbi:MAG: hypothetical protein AB7P23_11385 [Amphiplicatus sp.]
MSSAINKGGQFALDVAALRPRFGRADFEVKDSNRRALQTVDAFLASDAPALAICGPEGAGKTHLAHILARESGALVGDAADLERAAAAGAVVVIDNAERAADPKRLLALVEASRAGGARLALAGRGKPADWAQGLKDLKTRLEAMPRAVLAEPDEALMRAVIASRFQARQWRVSPDVARYAAPRLPRTFAAAAAFVDAVGAAAIAGGERITIPLARKVIDNLSETGSPEYRG